MAPEKSSRKYDILLLGATGYTGTFTAEHIAANLPTDLRWAIASTTRPKLDRLAAKLNQEYPNRVQPRKPLHAMKFDLHNRESNVKARLGQISKWSRVTTSSSSMLLLSKHVYVSAWYYTAQLARRSFKPALRTVLTMWTGM
jgi:hypothetical protein